MHIYRHWYRGGEEIQLYKFLALAIGGERGGHTTHSQFILKKGTRYSTKGRLDGHHGLLE